MKQTPGGGKNLISGGINSETPVILVYAFLVYYTEKKVSQRYEQQLIFAPPVGWTPNPRALNHSQAAAGIQGKGKQTWRAQGIHWSYKKNLRNPLDY